MERRAKKILMGLAIGDGYVAKIETKYGFKYRLFVTHCLKQEQYIRYKAKLLSQILNREINVNWIENNGYGAFRFSLSSKYLKFVYRWLYQNKQKKISLSFLRRLTDEAICFWYMDDGSLTAKKRNGKIHGYELVISTYCDEQSALNCIHFFKERYDVSFTLKRNKNKFSIRCGTKMAKKLLSHLYPYCVSDMKYKFF